MLSAENLGTIEYEGLKLLDFARPDPDRTVPQYPTWTLRDLVAHTASIHARTTAVCETRPQERIPAPELPDGREALGWYEENLSAMIEALRTTDPETDVWFFGPKRTIGDWERRMLIETGLHRWDAQQTCEDPEPLLDIVARRGLDEFPDMWLFRLEELPTLRVTATDLGSSWTYGDGDPTETARGTASDLYLRLMSRPGARLPDVWQAAVDGLATPAG